MRTLTRTLLVAWPLTLVMVAACSTEAVGPDGEVGPDVGAEEGTRSDELPADAPQLPVPASPLAEAVVLSHHGPPQQPGSSNADLANSLPHR